MIRQSLTLFAAAIFTATLLAIVIVGFKKDATIENVMMERNSQLKIWAEDSSFKKKQMHLYKSICDEADIIIKNEVIKLPLGIINCIYENGLVDLLPALQQANESVKIPNILKTLS